MGQYWIPVNLTKKEFVDPHKLASGLKLWELLANSPGVGGALIILTAAMPEARGGGDFDLEESRHGPERKNSEYPFPPCAEGYSDIAKRTIGRWAGDRIAIVGDYAENGDIRACNPGFRTRVGEGEIYSKCRNDGYRDITDDVRAVIEHELNGKFSDTDGWRDFKRED